MSMPSLPDRILGAMVASRLLPTGDPVHVVNGHLGEKHHTPVFSTNVSMALTERLLMAFTADVFEDLAESDDFEAMADALSPCTIATVVRETWLEFRDVLFTADQLRVRAGLL